MCKRDLNGISSINFTTTRHGFYQFKIISRGLIESAALKRFWKIVLEFSYSIKILAKASNVRLFAIFVGCRRN